jgi:hypothetical protein
MRILFIFHTGILEIEIEKQTGQFWSQNRLWKIGLIYHSDVSLYSLIWEMVHKSAFYIPVMALLNAHTLYLMENERSMTILDFKMSVIKELLQKHTKRTIPSRGGRCSSSKILQHVTDITLQTMCLVFSATEYNGEILCVYIFCHKP